MKKIILTVIAVFSVLVVLFFGKSYHVKFNDRSGGMARFIYKDKNIETALSDEHLNRIIDILEGKRMSASEPSCPFSENVSVIIDNQTFSIAGDDCGIIYFNERDRYIYLEDEENQEMRNLLKGYGFEFPCI